MTALPVPPDRPASSRHEVIDALRGLFLVLMAVNHVPMPQSIFPALYKPFAVMTSAEGFVLMAGLLLGLIYTRKLRRDGFTKVSRQLARRAGRIYTAHLICLAAVFVWMEFYAIFFGAGSPPVGSPWVLLERPLAGLLAAIFLVHQPGLLDVLPMYCGFVLLTPLVLHQLARGRARPVLLVSIALWLATNLLVAPHPLVRGLINTGSFNFGAWQLMYLSGLVAGHAWVAGRWPKWLLPSRPLLAAGLGGWVAFLVANHFVGVAWKGYFVDSWIVWTNKNNLCLLRLLNVGFVVMTVFAYCGLRSSARRFLGDRGDRGGLAALVTGRGLRLLALLGRHSLGVFSVHVVVALIILGLPHWFEWNELGRWVGPSLLLTAMVVAAWSGEQFARRAKSKADAALPLSAQRPLV